MKKICLVRSEKNFWSELSEDLQEANAELVVLEGIPRSQQILDCRPDLIITCAEAHATMIHRLRRLPIIVVLEETPSAVIEKKLAERNLSIVYWPLPRRKLLDCISRMLNVPPRNTFKTLIRIYSDGSDMGTIGQSLDFSTGGISFQSESLLLEGQKCFLSFYIPEVSKSLRLQVKVVRSRRDEEAAVNLYGAAFIELGAEDLRIMKAFVLGQ